MRLLALACLMTLTPAASAQRKANREPPPAEFPLAALGGRPGAAMAVPLPQEMRESVTTLWTPGGWPVLKTETGLLVGVPADAPTGFVPVRLVLDGQKFGPWRLLSVDPFPELAAPPEASRRETAPTLTAPCVVVGTVEAETVHTFKLQVTAGVPVVIEAFARRLGSPLDPSLTLTDEAGRLLPGGVADDTPGRFGDCELVFTPAESGTVHVELRDSTYQGGPAHRYRLRIGGTPTPVATEPMVLTPGDNQAVAPVFADGTRGEPVTVSVPEGSAAVVLPLTDCWPRAVPVAAGPVVGVTEAETALPGPCDVAGQFTPGRTAHTFTLPVPPAGGRFTVRAETRQLLSPCEVYLTVRQNDKELAKSKPEQSTAEVEFTAPEAGTVTITAESLTGLGGVRERYWLEVRPRRPEAAVGLVTPEVVLARGGTNLVPVAIKRDDFAGAFTLEAVPPLAGRVRVPAGAAGTVWLPVTALDDVPVGPHQLAVVARFEGGTTRPVAPADRPGGWPVEWQSVASAFVADAPPVIATARLRFAPVKSGGTTLLTLDVSGQGVKPDDLTLTTEEPFKAGPTAVAAGRLTSAVTLPAKLDQAVVNLPWRLLDKAGRVRAAGSVWLTPEKPAKKS